MRIRIEKTKNNEAEVQVKLHDFFAKFQIFNNKDRNANLTIAYVPRCRFVSLSIISP